MVSGSFSLPCSGCFPPFPHGTGPLSVFREYLALRDGPRGFRQDFSCPALLRYLTITVLLPVRGCHPLRPSFPTRSSSIPVYLCETLLPRLCRNIVGLGSAHFARHYSGYRCFFLFLKVLRCFSSLRSPWLYASVGPSTRRVAPFGNLRIYTCLQFPGAFRSLPRPSSPPKA